MLDVEDTTRCVNCGAEFADHNYVPDSMTKYKCPRPHQECGYGFFCGGDPRDFHPDHECCDAKEIENHRHACELWDEAEERGETPEPEKCPSGWVYDAEGKPLMHVLRAPYGIGTYTMEWEQFFEAVEHDYEDEEDDDE